jgi:hypothetical protein
MKKLALIVGALALPVVSLAQQHSNLETLVQSIGRIVNLVIPIIFAIALLGFFYGLVVYIFGAEQNKDQAKKTMIWGVVALFVMASVWGLVSFIGSAVGVNQDTAPTVNPLIPK